MHAKRAQRGMHPDAPVQERLPPLEAAIRSWCALADVDSENDLAYAQALERATKASKRWMRSIGYAKTPAVDALAETVPHAVKTTPRGSTEQQERSAESARTPIPEGAERESGRHAGVVQGNARAGGQSRTSSDRPAGAAHAAAKAPAGREGRRGGAARPGRAEAVRHRARQARRDHP